MAKRKQPNLTQYQIKTEPPYRFLTDVPRFEWRTPWSTPPTQMGAKSKQFGAAHIAGIGVTQPPTQFLTAVPRFEWRQPWSVPPNGMGPISRMVGAALIAATGLFAPVFTPPAAIDMDWLTPLSDPIRVKSGLHPSLHDVTADVYPTTETVTVDKWWSPWADPTRKPSLATAQQQSTAFQLDDDTQIIEDFESRWHQPWSEPVRLRQFTPAQQQPFTSSPLPYVSFSWFKDLSEPTRLRRVIAQDQPFVATTTTEVVTVDKWFQQLNDPTRIKLGLNTALQAAYTTEYFPDTTNAIAGQWYGSFSEPVRPQSSFRALYQAYTTEYYPDTFTQWFTPLSEPARAKRSLNAPDQSWVLFVTTETVTVDKWFDPLSEPVRTKPALRAALQPATTYDAKLFPDPANFLEGWSSGLAEPVRQKLGLNTALQSVYTTGYFSFEIITVDKWFEQLSDPTRRKPEDRDRYNAENEFTAIAATMKWYAPLTEPVRLKIGLHVSQQQTLAYAVTFTSEVVTVDKWYRRLEDPVRAKHPADDRYQGENNWEAVAASMEWFAPFTEPVRFKPGLVPATRPPFFASPAVIIIPSLASWWRPLAEPPKAKVSLGTHLQQAFTQDPKLFPNPSRFLEGWYNWFSEPVRHLAQLNAALQRSWTASDRRPVLATITVTMVATEVNNDVPLFAVRVLPYNPPATAVVSLTEIGHGASLTSIVEEGDDGSGTSVVES